MSVSSVAERWVEEVAGLTQPARVVWCDGSKPEYDTLIEAMLQWPGCSTKASAKDLHR